MPETASVMPSRSGHRLRHTAEPMPITMPNTTAHAIDATVSSSVGMKRSPISSLTGRLVRSELPNSPRIALEKKLTNCSGSGRSRPRSLRTSSTVAESASGPAASRAGSPGSRWTNRNTSTATISSVGITPSTRLRK
ncbi:hypothetical protein FQZ97_846110 [compost metagenome]